MLALGFTWVSESLAVPGSIFHLLRTVRCLKALPRISASYLSLWLSLSQSEVTYKSPNASRWKAVLRLGQLFYASFFFLESWFGWHGSHDLSSLPSQSCKTTKNYCLTSIPCTTSYSDSLPLPLLVLELKQHGMSSPHPWFSFSLGFLSPYFLVGIYPFKQIFYISV